MGRSDAKVKAHTLATDRLYDITLNECANSSKKYSRSRKVDITDTKRITSNLASTTLDEVDSDTEDESSPTSPVLHVPHTVPMDGEKQENHVTYPSDIWHLIACYIPVEELGTFALICRDANRVLHSVHFWRQLFKRYYKADLPHLPRDLRVPALAVQRHGLRCRTIRLLYLSRPLLTMRLLCPRTPRYEPYALQGMRLMLMWYKGERNHWNYYFQFQDNRRDHEKGTSSLFHNPETGCRILKVTCPDFVHHKYLDEKYLCSVYLGLTSDMVHQRLTLGFSDYVSTHRGSKSKQHTGRSSFIHNMIVLERVTKCVILDWWHPEYPHFQEPPQTDEPVLCSLDVQNEEW